MHKRGWRLWGRKNDQPHHTWDAFSTHKRGWRLWGSKNDQRHHSWDAFSTHQKRGWHQTGRRSAAALRGIRVRGASLFSRMWEGAAAPLRGGFSNQPHRWENFRSSCTIRRKKIFSRAPGFQRPPRRSLQLCTAHGQPSHYASLELFFVFIKKILLVENDLHVLKKVN